jgi:hypothetical protein
MYKTKPVLKVLLISLAITACSDNALANEKSAPERINQETDAESGSAQVFVQLAKESTIYFSSLKFTQEVQT